MRRVLVSLAAVALGAAVLMPTAAAAPPPSAGQPVQPSEHAQPVESGPPEASGGPIDTPQPIESFQPTESQPTETAQPPDTPEPSASPGPDESAAPVETAVPTESGQPAESPPIESARPSEAVQPSVSPAIDGVQPSQPPNVTTAGPDDGNLRIDEVVEGAPEGWSGTFEVVAECGDAGTFDVTIAYPDPGTVTIPTIDAGVRCWVYDTWPEPPEGYDWDGFHETVTPSPVTIVSGQTVTVTIVNRLISIDAPALYVEKSAWTEDSWGSDNVALVGSTITYEIYLYNYGAVTLHDITLVDDHQDLAAADCVVPDLKPGDEFSCTYTSVVKAGVTTNTVTADSNETEPETASATVHGYAEWPLAITKTNAAPPGVANLPTAVAGDIVTFTITYTFAGDSATMAQLYDYLPEGMTYVAGSATSTDEMVFRGVETYEDEDDQESWLTWGADSLSTGGTLTYSVKIDRDAAGYDQPITNFADVWAETGDVYASAESAVYVTTIPAEATSPTGTQPTAPPTDMSSASQPSTTDRGVQVILVLFAGITFGVAVTVPTSGSRRQRNVR